MNEKDFYGKMLDNVYEGIYFVDTTRKITFWNKGAEEITGFKAEEVIGRYCHDNILNHVDDSSRKLCLGGCPLHETIHLGIRRDANVYLHHKDGHRVTVKVRTIPLNEDGVKLGAIEFFVKVNNSINDYSDLIEFQQLAYIDQLTNLPNRRYLDKYLESQIIISENMGTKLGIAFIDIDFFKKINDSYGHRIGDDVLKMVSKTMSEGIRRSDIIGRWGGEEFIFIIDNTNEYELERVTEKLRMLVENSGLRHPEKEIKVTISIGASIYKAGETAEDIISRTDKLLYESKKNGRNRVTLG